MAGATTGKIDRIDEQVVTDIEIYQRLSFKGIPPRNIMTLGRKTHSPMTRVSWKSAVIPVLISPN